MTKKDFISLADFTQSELEQIIALAFKLKKEPHSLIAANKHLAMIFEKSSTRTRISFEVAINQLGGKAVILNTQDMQLGRGETIADTAKILSRYVDLIMIRANKHQDVITLAESADIPVINGLTDFNHPCQLLTDIFTYIEHKGSIKDKLVAWLGDGNNMCNSWLNAALIFGFRLNLAIAKGYYPDQNLLARARAANLVNIYEDAKSAAKDADLITTDTWVSMGDQDSAARKEAFSKFQVTEELMSLAKADAIFMHCLPAHRGEEVTAEVIDGRQSVVFTEAENRLHIQKAIISFLLSNK